MRSLFIFIIFIAIVGFSYVYKFSEHPTYPQIKYYPNGQIKSIGSIQNGSPIGSWISFYLNGQIESVRHFSTLYNEDWTFSVGSSIEYYTNGKIKRRVQFFNPDFPDSNFNYVGQYPGISDGYDIVLPNGEIYSGEVWDSTGIAIVKTYDIDIKGDKYILPIEYFSQGNYLKDTFYFKMNKNGWLDYGK